MKYLIAAVATVTLAALLSGCASGPSVAVAQTNRSLALDSVPATVSRAPGLASFIVPAATLGNGAGRVDIYMNDVKVGNQTFTVNSN